MPFMFENLQVYQKAVDFADQVAATVSAGGQNRPLAGR
jgi:hypothetical protein